MLHRSLENGWLAAIRQKHRPAKAVPVVRSALTCGGDIAGGEKVTAPRLFRDGTEMGFRRCLEVRRPAAPQAKSTTPASPASVANASTVPAVFQASAEIGSPAGRRARISA